MAYSAGRVGSMQKLRESLKKGGGGNSQYIKQVPANDIMTVRFLTEPEDWYGYYETYDTEIKRYYPLIEGVEKPEGARVSYRYLAVALDVENDQVIPLKLPKDLANRLIMRYDRYETLMDRDYELSRMGEGLDTTYDVTPGDKVARHLDKYTLIDLDAVLAEAASVVTGGTTSSSEAPASPRERAAVAKKAAPKKAEKTFDDNDEFFAGTTTAPAEEFAEDTDDEFDTDDDPPQTAGEAESVEDDDDYLTEDDLQKMSLSDLKAFAKEFDLNTDDLGKDEIIQQIFASAG